MYTIVECPTRYKKPVKVKKSCNCGSITVDLMNPWVSEEKCLMCGYTIAIEKVKEKESNEELARRSEIVGRAVIRP